MTKKPQPYLCRVFGEIARKVAESLENLAGRQEYMEVIGFGVSGDLSRRIDLLAEELVVSEVGKLGLSAWVVSEEKGVWKLADNPEFIVLVDPLDGSLNYYLGIPFASVSIAVYRRGSHIASPLYGVVRSVFSNVVVELCEDTVFLNEQEIPQYLSRGFEVVSIYTENPYHIEVIVRKLEERGVKAKTRTMGSAALEASYAAIGLIGHFVHLTGRLRNVDIPVALAIASRLGAEVYTEPRLEELEVSEVQLIRKVLITQRDSGLREVIEKL